MKLIVITNKDDIQTLVPKISEYSNTQNKVSLADLSANDPPHPELHEISKRLPAPDPTGGSRQTYWFYEKARGSYEETENLEARTPAKRQAFEALYPRNQRFDKSTFGKAWNTFLGKPDVVSLGAQKNFANFNMWLREQVNEDRTEFFKKTVALVMLWKNTEKIVRYKGFDGYHHNIVTYTLAWLYRLTKNRIDLDKLWRTQAVGKPIIEAIESMCIIVNDHIRNTTRNVTEWCKKEDCWASLKDKNHELPNGIEGELIPKDSPQQEYDPSIIAEKELVQYCVEKGHEAWFELAKWLKQMKFLEGKARSQCFNMGKMIQRGKTPSYWLAKACKRAWEEAKLRGWRIGEDKNNHPQK